MVFALALHIERHLFLTHSFVLLRPSENSVVAWWCIAHSLILGIKQMLNNFFNKRVVDPTCPGIPTRTLPCNPLFSNPYYPLKIVQLCLAIRILKPRTS